MSLKNTERQGQDQEDDEMDIIIDMEDTKWFRNQEKRLKRADLITSVIEAYLDSEQTVKDELLNVLTDNLREVREKQTNKSG